MSQNESHLSTIYNPRYRRMIAVLAALRKEHGLTQTDMADILRLNQSDISKIERCVRRLDALELLDWLRATGKDGQSLGRLFK